MSSESSDTRPKSIATVVVDLFGVAARSSTPVLASVSTASVVSGAISDTDPTNVVLPTPNPPATTIFAEIVAGPLATEPGVFWWSPIGAPRPAAARCESARSESTESTQNPFHETELRHLAGAGRGAMHHDEPNVRHIRQQHPDHPEREDQQRSHLGHRTWFEAQLAPRPMLHTRQRRPATAPRPGG